MQPPLYFTSGEAAAVALSAATEAVVATCSGIVTPYSNQTVALRGTVLLTTGTTTTSVICQVRRLSLTGTAVSDATNQTIVAAAGSTNVYDVTCTDAPGEVTGYTYVLTVTDTGGGTGGTTVYATLEAFVF